MDISVLTEVPKQGSSFLVSTGKGDRFGTVPAFVTQSLILLYYLTLIAVFLKLTDNIELISREHDHLVTPNWQPRRNSSLNETFTSQRGHCSLVVNYLHDPQESNQASASNAA